MYIYYEMHSAIKNILDEDVCSFKTYNFCVGERHISETLWHIVIKIIHQVDM
jgi:hypothetical protein